MSPSADKADRAEFHAVVLAGGRCARMYPLTEKCPKALLPVANRPVIDYCLDLLEKAGFSGVQTFRGAAASVDAEGVW